MSSGDEDIDTEQPSVGQELKKRRIQRACDTCRRKKIRCDGRQMPNNRCSNCTAYNQDCTYVEAAKKRGPPKGYVESLENRLESMEKLLQRICPGKDFTQELGPRIDRESWTTEKRSSPASMTVGGFMIQKARHQTNPYLANVVTGSDAAGLSMDPGDLAPSEDECGPDSTLAEGLRRLAIDSPLDRRFHGKSSGVMLIQTAMNLKKEFVGPDASPGLVLPSSRRPEFWYPLPWEMAAEERPVQYHYPPDDLIPSLVNSYFKHINPFMPLLHRPSFERSLRDKRHHSDIGFGSVLMLVCALGSQWSDDPRCMLDGVAKRSAGWKWFDQVQVLRRDLIGPPRLHDLQVVILSANFLNGSSSPQSSWTLVGIGLRLAQDVGAHRRKVYDASLSIEAELWKRAFWVLVNMDRFYSAGLGRPYAVQDEDFDLDLPVDVDDEYWEHPDPSQAFEQPPGKPSYMSFFISLIKLNQILAFALRTIYSINKSKVLLGFVGAQWEQHIVAEVDSALNKWIDTVPDHLRWDPYHKDTLFFNQSAILYTTYYHIQILVHRPFISSSRKPSPLTYSSLAICTNAARSSSHITDALHRRGDLLTPHVQMSAFSAGIVLLLNIWGAKKAGTFIDVEKQMEDVHKCMNALRGIEERFIVAGRLWDILNELVCASNLYAIMDSPPSNKRERGSDSPKSKGRSGSHDAGKSPSPNTLGPTNTDASFLYRTDAGGGQSVVSAGSLASAAPSQTPSSSNSSPEAVAGGLPYDAAYLAGTNPEMIFTGAAAGAAGVRHGAVGIDSAVGGMGAQHAWDSTPGDSSGVHVSMPHNSLRAQAPLRTETSVYSTSRPSASAATIARVIKMPDPNYFDIMEVTVPQEVPNIHMSGHRFIHQPGDSGPAAMAKGYSHGPGIVYDHHPHPLPHPSHAAEGYGRGPDLTSPPAVYQQLSTGMASMNEALQMWSSAPTSFVLEDWGSYTHNFSGGTPGMGASGACYGGVGSIGHKNAPGGPTLQ